MAGPEAVTRTTDPPPSKNSGQPGCIDPLLPENCETIIILARVAREQRKCIFQNDQKN